MFGSDKPGASQPVVLFVDDDQANLVVFEATCSKDFNVITTDSGEKALEIMKEHEVGVLISDQRMPGMSGVELLEKAHHDYPDTVRILITAYSDLNAAISAINQGHVRRYMRKPWVPEELRAVLKESVDIYLMTHRMRSLEQRLLKTERVYALGVVAAGIAQELREPNYRLVQSLERAKTALHALNDKASLSKAAAEALEEVDDELAEAIAASKRITDVVRGIELPIKKSEDESSDLGEVLRLTLKLVRRELQNAAEVRIDLQSVPKVRGSTAKLGQVVLNLIMNAARAASRAKTAEMGLITISLHQVDRHVEFIVADNGATLSKDQVEKMFDPLYTDTKGHGLGLAISRAIVDELGGELEAIAQPEGLAFKVLLPVAA